MLKHTVSTPLDFHPDADFLSLHGSFTYYPDQPCAATVAYAWTSAMVNLRVVDHAGSAWAVHSVYVVGEDEDFPPENSGCFATLRGAVPKAQNAPVDEPVAAPLSAPDADLPA